nr:hypothetical protein [Bacilli bacterium]
MDVYTYMNLINLDTIVANKKAREEKIKSYAAAVKNNEKTDVENKIDAKEETKIDNKIDLINPGVELTVKNQNIDVPSRTKIYLNSPAKRNINQRRRG